MVGPALLVLVILLMFSIGQKSFFLLHMFFFSIIRLSVIWLPKQYRILYQNQVSKSTKKD